MSLHTITREDEDGDVTHEIDLDVECVVETPEPDVGFRGATTLEGFSIVAWRVFVGDGSRAVLASELRAACDADGRAFEAWAGFELADAEVEAIEGAWSVEDECDPDEEHDRRDDVDYLEGRGW